MESGVETRLLGQEKEEEEEKLATRMLVESKILWRIAAPAIFTRVTTFGILVISQAFAGHLSAIELAAFSLVQTVLLRFGNGIMLGMASALETLCGQAFGAKQQHMLGIYLQRSWLILTITAILLTPLFVFSAPILRLLGQTEEISTTARKFSLWFIPVFYSFIFNFTQQMFLQAQLKNMIIAWLAAVALVLHVILSWVLVVKLDWGMTGVMIPLIIGNWFPVFGSICYVLFGGCPDTWKGFSTYAFTELWPVIKLSISSGVMLCLELWYNTVLILLTGHLKNAEVEIDALSICLNISAWEMMISLGFLAAASVRVSNELGRGNAKKAKFAIVMVAATSFSIGLFFWLIFLLFSDKIAYIFTSSTEVVKTVSDLSVLLAFSILLNSVQPVLSGVAIGAGWQSIVAYVNIACYYIVGIPLGILLGYITHLEVKGIWIGMMCGTAAQTLVLLCITWRTDWDMQVERIKLSFLFFFVRRSNPSLFVLFRSLHCRNFYLTVPKPSTPDEDVYQRVDPVHSEGSSNETHVTTLDVSLSVMDGSRWGEASFCGCPVRPM